MRLNLGGGRYEHPGWLNLDISTGFAFTPECVFPVDSAEVVYSSHCLEHLDDATVDRALSETARVLKGPLVLKLPDFDKVLQKRLERDRAFFDQWGIHKRWKTEDIDERAAIIFCGHPIKGDFSGTPHEVAKRLVAQAPKERDPMLHRNAWGRDELTELLARHGFRVEPLTENVPELDLLKPISLYVQARRTVS